MGYDKQRTRSVGERARAAWRRKEEVEGKGCSSSNSRREARGESDVGKRMQMRIRGSAGCVGLRWATMRGAGDDGEGV